MTKPRSFAVAAFLLLLASPQAGSAAVLNRLLSKEGKVIVVLKGDITEGDADRLTSIIRLANESNKFVSGVRLNSMGGNLVEGIKLADVIRGAKMATIVPNGATCASACFVAFAAGSEKFASNNASIGVHGASENGSETPASSAATIGMARIVKDLGVPAAVLGKMVVTLPTEVVWLSANDLRAMGTTMTGRPAQIVSQAPMVPQQVPAEPSSGIQAKAPPTWTSIVNSAFARSAGQNNGKALFNRVCQPEMKICSNAVFSKANDGTSMMIRTTEDMDGKLLKRELCTFNNFGDIRRCLDWDTSIIRTDMKDAKGEWATVADK